MILEALPPHQTQDVQRDGPRLSNGSHEAMRLACVKSHVGCVRAGNEDACAVSAVADRVAEWRGSLSEDGGWALLADGLGGHAAGEIASAIAIAILAPVMANLRSKHDVATAILSADTALYLAMERAPELDGMGTTIAGVVLNGDEALAFNIGDSRIYAFIDDELEQVSVDDAVDDHLLTQCLGGSQAQVRLVPHITRVPLEPGTALLLCSDGLTDMLSDDEIAAIISGGAADPANALVEAALKAGGHDNVSVIFISSEKMARAA